MLKRRNRAYEKELMTREPASRTDWERLDAMTDEEIDTSDSPPLTEEFFARAVWMMPGERSPCPSVEIALVYDAAI